MKKKVIALSSIWLVSTKMIFCSSKTSKNIVIIFSTLRIEKIFGQVKFPKLYINGLYKVIGSILNGV